MDNLNELLIVLKDIRDILKIKMDDETKEQPKISTKDRKTYMRAYMKEYQRNRKDKLKEYYQKKKKEKENSQ
jgi:hypothetical protein